MAKSSKNGKHPGGRPTKLTPKMAAHIHVLSRRGFTDKQIAEFKEIDEKTIHNWKVSDRFFQFLKEAKEVSDSIVQMSLYERAVGYEIPEEKVFCNANGEVTRVATIKHYPPDVTAQIFWLKNRQRSKWRDRFDHGSDPENPIRLVITHRGLEAPTETPRLATTTNGHARA